MGAASATLISIVSIGLARVIEVHYFLKLSFFSSNLYKPLLAGLITLCCMISIRSFVMSYHTVVTLSIATLSSILIYGFVLCVLKLEPEDHDFWSGLIILKGGKD